MSALDDFPDKTAQDFPDKGLLRRGYEGLKSAASYPFELAGKLDVASGIKTPEQAASRAKMYGGLTTDLALTAPFTGLGGLAGEALSAGGRLLPAVGRIAGSAAGGAATEGLGGGSPTTGAITGGLAAGALEGAGALVPKGLDVARRAYGKATGSADRAVDLAKRTLSAKEAERVGKEAGEVIPGLGVKGPDLHKLTLGGEGRQILNAQFKASLEGVDAALKNARITKIKVPELSDQPMTVREAVDALQLVGKGMGQAPAGARSVGQRFAALDYGAARQALVQRLNQVVPGAGDQLSQALQRSAQGRAYLKLVGQSLDRSGQLDPAKLAANVNKYAGVIADKFGPKAPQMTKALTGGKPLPVAVPKPPGPTTTPSLGPAGMLAADVLGTQPGAREAIMGMGEGAGKFLLRHVPGHSYLPIELEEGYGGDGG